MKLIVVSGPSGSGKTTLSKIILKKIKNGIILNTDNYYKTGIISQIFSKILTCYFDRKISFNLKLFKRDLKFILKNGFSNFSYKYNFKRKSIKKIYKQTKNIRLVIIEGIFGEEVIKSLSTKNFILIKLKTEKQICMRRAIKRDSIERGKTKNNAHKDFLKAWDLFYKNEKKFNSSNYIKKFIVRNISDIRFIQKNLLK
tara:strand:+ start:343 stop:939 length:597 start_codon:yes stop_codon:yes gene_type:complete